MGALSNYSDFYLPVHQAFLWVTGFGLDCLNIYIRIILPTYDENLLAYWEMNPYRYPGVMESRSGHIRVAAEDDFITQWLENDFGATEVIEYSYITVYRRQEQ